MNKQESSKARTRFNVTSFPTLYYAENGEIKKEFDQERTKEGIIAFMKEPLIDHKKKLEEEDWESDPDSEIVHLATENFETSLRDEKSALVMFHTNCRCFLLSIDFLHLLESLLAFSICIGHFEV